MLILLLILLPFFGGLLIWLLQAKAARGLALLTSLLTMCTALVSYFFYSSNQHWNELSVNHAWIETLGARFNMALHPGDGLALMMVLLTSIGFPFIFLYQLNKDQDRPKTFYSLMLWVQSGLLGVFLAKDALLFYIFWEVALIPVYFLASMYGGERRKAVSFKFFIYTFSGSLLMLLGLLYVYIQTPIHSFDWDSMLSAGKAIPATTQHILFWFMFVAFAIKMPVFPFHTWQPDAYEESAAPVTMVLSAFMVKMGLFAVVRWLMPVVPEAASFWMNLVIALSVCGIVYASLMALVQTNLKRMLAYSSIAHIGLMCAAIFSHQLLGMQGAAIQMFNHGITILGLWMLGGIIEQRLQTQDMRSMGGIASVAPWFSVMLVVLSLANIALPLTNGFIGEFMMFNGLFESTSKYHMLFTVIAGIGIILSAVYTLGMIQKVIFGEARYNGNLFTDLTWNEKLVLGLIVAGVLILGFYPKVLMDLIYVETIFK